jgi:hypothetical protein
MSKGKETEGFNILDSISTVSTIDCDICRDTAQVEDDHGPASQYFIERGWRRPKEKTYCPECAARKKLKPL